MISQARIPFNRNIGLRIAACAVLSVALSGCEPLDFGGGGEVGGGNLAFLRQGALHISLPGGAGERTLTEQDTSINPAFSPNGASIAFGYQETSDSGENYSIYVIGTNINAVPELVAEAPFGTSYHSPTWSPDGNNIVFVAESDTEINLMQVPATGGSPFPLGAEPGLQFPSYINDSSMLVLKGNFDLYRMNLTGFTLSDLHIKSTTRPAVSRDGTLVATSTSEGRGHIVVHNLQSGQSQDLPSSEKGDIRPTFSPTGDVVAFEGGGQLLAVVLDDETEEIHVIQSGTDLSWGP